jgi:hypothetical protein
MNYCRVAFLMLHLLLRPCSEAASLAPQNLRSYLQHWILEQTEEA